MDTEKTAFVMVLKFCMVIMIVFCFCCVAPAQEEFEEEDEEMITIGFNEVRLDLIVKEFADQLQKNFLITQPLNAPITIVGKGQIPRSAAFDLLQTILNSANFEMVESEHLIKVEPLQKVIKPKMTSFLEKYDLDELSDQLSDRDNLVTVIIIPKHIEAQELLGLLKKFQAPGAVMDIFPSSNTIIIKDTEVNIRYLVELAKRVDVPGAMPTITIYKLKYALPRDISNLLRDIISTKGFISSISGPDRGSRTPGVPAPKMPVSRGSGRTKISDIVKVISYDRMNALVIVAPERETNEIIELIKQFDQPSREEEYYLKIYQVENQEAGKLAQTLDKFVKDIARIEKAVAGGVAPGGSRKKEQNVFFASDKETNKILLYAPPQEHKMYMSLIKELDQPQSQVLIEAWVVEISSTDQFDIGVEILPSTEALGARSGPIAEEIYTASSFGLGLGPFAQQGTIPSSGLSALVRTTNNTKVKLGDKIFQIPDFDAFMRVLQQNTEVEVLSSPKLLTLNNKSASIEVSNQIFTSSSRVSGVGENRDVVEQFDKEDVGIKLEMEPQINPDGYVIFNKLSVEVSSIVGAEITEAGSRPVIAKRTAGGNVRIKDGETIVIGGLRRNDRTRTTTKVPILGDIPILGVFFRSSSTIKVNTNLFVFITPHIVTDTPEMISITETMKKQDLNEERSRFKITRDGNNRKSRKHRRRR